jgi:stage V sporulation protein R
MIRSTDPDRRQIAAELQDVAADARQLAEKLGLEGYPVNYWIVGYDEMNELIAYEGFPTRYPHWRWGMQYDRQRKQDRYGAGKAFEIVVNDDPAHAYLQESNSLADQKAVITHVEAHVDFFRNNRWFGLFGDEVDAVRMLERHAHRIQAHLDDTDIDREDVERFIDSVLPLVDTIDQHSAFAPAVDADEDADDSTDQSLDVDALGLSTEIEAEVFGPEFELQTEDVRAEGPVRDVLAYLREHGKQYDEESGKAVEMEPWQREVLEILRREAYYFAPQKLTKVMNEGFAAYYESLMMGEEAFATAGELFQYADHQSRVLGSQGLNPYKLGKELWEYIENTTNRREVYERLLAVEGVTWSNFDDAVDLDRVLELLEPTPPLGSISADRLDELAALDPAKVDQDALSRARAGEIDVDRHPWKLLTYEGLAERHFSLVKPHNRGVLKRVGRADLERIDRYLPESDRYEDVDAAIQDVAYTAGWDRILEVRESHNDVTFLDEFLTEEFVRENEYFAYEFDHRSGGFRVSSTDPDDVKRKLLLRFANFGKPTIVVEDGNYQNRNELLLSHQYNGVDLDIGQALRTLERVFDLWGRPVNLRTIVSEIDESSPANNPSREEQGKLLRYDGEDTEIRDLPWDRVEDIAADEVDYDTKPDDWL